ncbi:TetR/AcrR family transcriptional regulator [Streptomonospora nanhaiensis]|uniref:AcrR family transcriptional regulator n=1 Tax=Streptomonospora nanhaiensis TaxID=1323731 RepID=A0A853BI29_9ACTN|nr:TetR/AcrR family transcriptional regulator [Streptomonospora nanhaiensis]MBV2366479.1 TetR/AcrR family transcriptional regulator; helix-turn-helix transcriptional regulator [Streptomonospora nanhaiensis]MBX9391402.1 TetR/AcrR family transcriptional regulator; helix-turn-helix transcriptional regulator [Streptomonospora nanhaiensis]NYI94271.1 AcrR family transcriptional regulator [Streptomonospora nanhaiensis]
MSISNEDDGGGSPDPLADTLLDAAYESIAVFGLRRLTLTDVARRAGVSRPTVYRRWRDIGTLLADLLTREMRAVVDSVAPRAAAAGGDARTRLVAGAVLTVAELRGHPLLGRIIDTEPEALITYTFHRLGSSQSAMLAVTEDRIRAGQADGSVRAGDPAELARMMLLAAQAAVVSWRLVDDVLPLERQTAELGRMLDAYLRPADPA